MKDIRKEDIRTTTKKKKKKVFNTNTRPPAASCFPVVHCLLYWLLFRTSIHTRTEHRKRKVQLTTPKVIQIHSFAQVNNPSQVGPPLGAHRGDQKPGRETSPLCVARPYKRKMEKHSCSLTAYARGQAPISLPKALHRSPSRSFPHSRVLPCSSTSPKKETNGLFCPG